MHPDCPSTTCLRFRILISFKDEFHERTCLKIWSLVLAGGMPLMHKQNQIFPWGCSCSGSGPFNKPWLTTRGGLQAKSQLWLVIVILPLMRVPSLNKQELRQWESEAWSGPWSLGLSTIWSTFWWPAVVSFRSSAWGWWWPAWGRTCSSRGWRRSRATPSCATDPILKSITNKISCFCACYDSF